MTSPIVNNRYGRQYQIDLVAMLFGLSAWLGINSIFSETALLLNTAHLPEGMKFNSFLAITVQLGNIGPLIFTFMRRFTRLSEKWFIYALITFIILVNITVACFYDTNATIFGAERSIVLLTATFVLSLHACTSSVLYIPYMRHFSQVYITTFMFGEGLSSLVPSALAFAQGSGGDNVPPRFSVTVYFLVLAVVLSMSLLAFYLLNNMSTCKFDREMVLTGNFKREQMLTNGDNSNDFSGSDQMPAKTVAKLSMLIVFTFLLTFFSNGCSFSLQAYSARNYGEAYFLVSNFGLVASTVGSFSAIFGARFVNMRGVAAMFVCLFLLVVYVSCQALSAHAFIENLAVGKAVIVVCWVGIFLLVSFVKSCMMALFRKIDGRFLYWAGIATQCGSLSGAVFMFLLDNVANVFPVKN